MYFVSPGRYFGLDMTVAIGSDRAPHGVPEYYTPGQFSWIIHGSVTTDRDERIHGGRMEEFLLSREDATARFPYLLRDAIRHGRSRFDVLPFPTGQYGDGLECENTEGFRLRVENPTSYHSRKMPRRLPS